MIRKIFTVLATLTLFVVATPAAAQDVKVIVNSANSTADLPGDVVTKLFLKRSSARAAFSKSVLGRGVAAVESYWQQQIFSGKDVPPPTKASDDEVVAFVKANAGAIGYVSAGASTAGVKVIEVK
jgi:ABC-type phosphate transport system substrate-binding protein